MHLFNLALVIYLTIVGAVKTKWGRGWGFYVIFPLVLYYFPQISTSWNFNPDVGAAIYPWLEGVGYSLLIVMATLPGSRFTSQKKKLSELEAKIKTLEAEKAQSAKS